MSSIYRASFLCVGRKIEKDRGTASPAATLLALTPPGRSHMDIQNVLSELRQNSNASTTPSLHSKDFSRPHLAVDDRPRRKQPLPARNDVR